jgi:RNA polymerase sigma-70 factor, ECF subfamily
VNFDEWPHLDALRPLHYRLLRGDPDSTEKIVALALSPVVRILAHRHAGVLRDAISDAACDALLTYFRQPERFDPAKGRLLSYLVAIGDFRVRDWLRSQMRRDSREVSVGGSVELALCETNYSRGAYAELAPFDNEGRLGPEMELLVHDALPDARDRDVLSLIIEGRTEVDVFAAVLGISELPHEERRAQVKRHRDRVLKRLQRRRAAFAALQGM